MQVSAFLLAVGP